MAREPCLCGDPTCRRCFGGSAAWARVCEEARDRDMEPDEYAAMLDGLRDAADDARYDAARDEGER